MPLLDVNTGGRSKKFVSPEKPGYIRVFNDEFSSGSVPDSSKYFFYFTWGDENDPEEDTDFLEGDTGTTGRAGYDASLATISNGILNLNGVNETTRYGGQNFPHGTCMIRTKEAYLFGYFEARIRLPPGQGFWPAFWLMPAEYNDNALWEIDIFEAPSSATSQISFNVHWGFGYGSPNHNQSQEWFADDFTDGFHTFACEWGPSEIKWIIDGVQRKSFTTSAGINKDVPMQVLINFHIGYSWSGPTDGTTPWPSKVEVEYLRIYQLA